MGTGGRGLVVTQDGRWVLGGGVLRSHRMAGLSPPSVRLPRPASPLLDLCVIVGSEAIASKLMGMFQEGVAEEEAWPALKWFQEKW